VVLSGLLLLRGAASGHIWVRRPRWRWPVTCSSGRPVYMKGYLVPTKRL
jgi:hypothetical protein